MDLTWDEIDEGQWEGFHDSDDDRFACITEMLADRFEWLVEGGRGGTVAAGHASTLVGAQQAATERFFA